MSVCPKYPVYRISSPLNTPISADAKEGSSSSFIVFFSSISVINSSRFFPDGRRISSSSAFAVKLLHENIIPTHKTAVSFLNNFIKSTSQFLCIIFKYSADIFINR